jgi:hypothetical protein
MLLYIGEKNLIISKSIAGFGTTVFRKERKKIGEGQCGGISTGS